MIVVDYFAMLRSDWAGEKLVKADAYRRLSEKIDRTPSSIERKHQNISAVLDRMGLPFLAGLVPASNFQAKLFDAVQQRLNSDPELLDILTGRKTVEKIGKAAVPQLKIDMDPPDIRPAVSLKPEFGESDPPAGMFTDYAERDARNRELGEQGEKVVLEYEQQRLIQNGRGDLADKVRWTAKESGDGFGYDIFSFAGKGDRPDEERLLEVKTTTLDKTADFWITPKELRVSEEKDKVYRIIRLFRFNDLQKRGGFKLRPPLRAHISLQPTLFRASLVSKSLA